MSGKKCWLEGVLCVLALCWWSTSAEALEKPNILLFLVDDMGLMDTSVPHLVDEDGKPVMHDLNKYYRTPGMERLAEKGVVFSQFYANSVCSPTRISIMTGQSSARHRATQWINPSNKNGGPSDWNWTGMDSNTVSLPRILKAGGYHTIHCGKAHFGPNGHEGENPENIGFDVNIAGRAIGRPGSYYASKHYGGKMKRTSHAVYGLEKHIEAGTFLTEALTIEMIEAISAAVKEKKPFFAYMSHYAVHAPFDSDPRFADHYKGSGKPGNAQAYATLIEGMDKSLGDILDKLDELGVAEETLVIFLGDNGGDAPIGGPTEIACSAPLRGKKGARYEGGMRVPFITAWAKRNDQSALQKSFPVMSGIVHDEFATIHDLLPTLLDLTGLDAPKGHTLDGQSMRGILAGKKKQHPQTFLMHFPHSHRSSYFTVYREKHWKLIKNYKPKTGEPAYELFNLTDDPSESNNLAESRPEKLADMMAAMQRELDKAGALYH